MKRVILAVLALLVILLAFLFLRTDYMNDSKNCGAEGVECEAGFSCVEGYCVEI